MAGDCTKAYARSKLDLFTRQIVFMRPNTFIILDRVRSTNASFKKTWLLQAMKAPVRQGAQWVITHGSGRLFVQTLLPKEVNVRLCQNDERYSYGGKFYPPKLITGEEVECRMEVSPAIPATFDVFLHVLTTAESSQTSVPEARLVQHADSVEVHLPDAAITFCLSEMNGRVEMAGQTVGSLRPNL
jgi:heparin/heparan-sulfate lyase